MLTIRTTARNEQVSLSKNMLVRQSVLTTTERVEVAGRAQRLQLRRRRQSLLGRTQKAPFATLSSRSARPRGGHLVLAAAPQLVTHGLSAILKIRRSKLSTDGALRVNKEGQAEFSLTLLSRTGREPEVEDPATSGNSSSSACQRASVRGRARQLSSKRLDPFLKIRAVA